MTEDGIRLLFDPKNQRLKVLRKLQQLASKILIVCNMCMFCVYVCIVNHAQMIEIYDVKKVRLKYW